MKVVGIIAEYNPFHNGHKYQIQKARELTHADTVIVIMSGDFTQQGNVAIVDKFKRAEMAIKGGADLVIELPTIFATSSAEIFARGAVSILDKLNIIDYLVFGTECNNIDILTNITNKLISNKGQIDKVIQKEIEKGISYASARDSALKSILSDNEYLEFSKPNNILAIEYLKALKYANSKIKPVAIQREGSNHNDNEVSNSNIYSSATSIRNILEEKLDISSISKYVPIQTYELLSSSNMVFNENMYSVLRYKILSLGKENIKNIYDVSEGLENKIFDEIITSKTYEELINNIKSKRYTMSRIKRILAHILINISKEKYKDLSDVCYARILKVNRNNNILGRLTATSSLPVITTLNDNFVNLLPDKVKQSLMLDINASNTYQVISNQILNNDKTNMI